MQKFATILLRKSSWSKVLITVFCFMQLSLAGQSQAYQFTVADTLSLKSIAREVDSLLNEYVTRPSAIKSVSDTALLRLLFTHKFEQLNQADAFVQLYTSQMQYLKGDLGLRLSGNYIENFTTGVISDEDITYLRRVYFGLEWDLLNSGLFANRAKIKALEKQNQIAQLKYEAENKQNSYLYLYAYLTYLFKREKTNLLLRRKEVVDEQVKIARLMYLMRIYPWENLIELESKSAELAAMLADNQVYYNQRLKEDMPSFFMDDALMYDFLPVFSIDPQKMIEHFNQSQTDEQIRQLELERYKAEYWRWNDYVLRPFVRYNMLQPDAYDLKNYASVGLSASLPIKFKSRSQSEVEARLKIVENEQDINHFAAGNELLNHYYEFQFKKMQFTSFYFKKLKIEERLRKEMVMRDFDDESFSPLRVMQILEEKLAVESELIDLKKDMYLKLLKIHSYLDVENPNAYISIISPEEMGKRYDGYRYLYIWSEYFGRMSNEHLIAFLQNNEIKEVIISPGQDHVDKFREFVFKAQNEGIKTHLMVGENRLLGQGPEALRQWLNRFQDINYRGLHLDIEPHVMNDFRTRRQQYMQQYLALLEEARNNCNSRGIILSASIPMHYDTAEIREVYNKCDKVFVMAYEKPDLNFILRKIADELEAGKDKTIIALNPNDFADRLSMEAFISKLLSASGLSEIAIHDLHRLIQIDERSVYKVK
ncbi:MAG: hypothetical protein ACP5O2_11775 [Bacteroidales bacterium]